MILPSPTEAKPGSGIPDIFPSPESQMYPADVKKSPPPSLDSRVSSPSSPRYPPPRRPSGPITYTFEPLPSNSMLLTPPPKMPESQQPYHITVSMNCFTPTSYITSVRKRKWDGEVVGDFELGATKSGNPGTLCLRGNEYPITEILESQFNVFRTTWTWRVKSSHPDKYVSLYWDDYAGGGVLTCYPSQDRNSSTMLARFTPRTTLRRQGQPLEPPNLLVTSTGHELFDDILLSALLIERIRTTPS